LNGLAANTCRAPAPRALLAAVVALWAWSALAPIARADEDTASSSPASSSPASSKTGVAIVGLPPDHALTRQLQAELRVAGYRVSVSAESVASEQELRALARRLGVSGAIWVPGGDDSPLRIWATDPDSGATVDNTSADSPSEAAAAPRVAAMRIVELLRAGFRDLETEAAAPTKRPPTPSPPAPPPTCPEQQIPCIRTPPRFFVDIGPALAVSPGGLGPSVDLRLGFRWLVLGRWQLGAHALLPTLGVEIDDEEEGSARILVAAAALDAGYSFADPAAAWQPDIAIGAGAAIFPMEGIARSPLQSESDLMTTPLFYGRLGLSIRLVDRLLLRPGVQCGALVPAAEVRFAGREVATWGHPFVVASLSLETGFP
jgi:hypothetical protein